MAAAVDHDDAVMVGDEGRDLVAEIVGIAAGPMQQDHRGPVAEGRKPDQRAVVNLLRSSSDAAQTLCVVCVMLQGQHKTWYLIGPFVFRRFYDGKHFKKFHKMAKILS